LLKIFENQSNIVLKFLHSL